MDREGLRHKKGRERRGAATNKADSRCESTKRMDFCTKRCESTNDIYFEHMNTEFISSREYGFFLFRANKKKLGRIIKKCLMSKNMGM